MKKSSYNISIGLLFACAALVYAADEPAVTPAKTAAVAESKEPAKEPAKELTKAEMVENLNAKLGYYPDVLATIPGLAAKEGEGKKSYTYNAIPLEGLDTDILRKLFGEVNRFISAVNMDRFQRQMKNLKQIEDMNKMQKSMKQMAPPPKTYKPPRTY